MCSKNSMLHTASMGHETIFFDSLPCSKFLCIESDRLIYFPSSHSRASASGNLGSWCTLYSYAKHTHTMSCIFSDQLFIGEGNLEIFFQSWHRYLLLGEGDARPPNTGQHQANIVRSLVLRSWIYNNVNKMRKSCEINAWKMRGKCVEHAK